MTLLTAKIEENLNWVSYWYYISIWSVIM